MMDQDLRHVGIVGAGQMGVGIVQVFAQSGFRVTVQDISKENLGQARAFLEKNLAKRVSRKELSFEQSAQLLGRITMTTQLEEVAQCDLLIEAATENENIKSSIFKSVTPLVKPHTILATNTSSISITRLAASTDRPERFIGLHFMNPVPVMKLVEVIRGVATSQETYEICLGVVQAIGKQATVSEDYPGFIVNRVLIPMINEAVYMLMEGVGTADSIDTAMKLGANQPMGPLELADFIGLDTCLSIMLVLYNGMHDPKYRPCPLLQKYVDAGWLGRKAGVGFYNYATDPKTPTR